MSGHVPACFVDGTRVCGFDEHPESVLSVPDSLDAAWAEAEAALPEGQSFVVWRRTDRAGEASYSADLVTIDGYVTMQVDGPTPAAALRSLAAKLKESR